MKFLIGCGIALGALLLIGGILLMVGISVRNGLIANNEEVSESWAQIDTQLQRRGDLIPNLVKTVKGYAKHESKVFENISKARSMLLAAKGPAQKAKADAMVNGALGRLLAIAENYPNLKADTSFIRLQDELAGTENRIAVARRRYNIAVKQFNVSIRKFPGSLFAPGLGFKKAEYYEPPNKAALQKPPEVNFDN